MRRAMEGKCHRTLGAHLFLFMMLRLCSELGVAAKEAPEGCGKICCPLHKSGGEEPKPWCEGGVASASKCGRGELCADLECKRCRQFQDCTKGEELQCSGTIDFNFFCQKCPNGTYSDQKNGCCTPWTNCKAIGLRVVRPGNHIHNVHCGQEDPINIIVQPDSMFTTILAIITAGGMFLLILMTFFLLICTWTQKKARFDAEELESVDASESRHLHEDEHSCQFPEEEHGDKLAEEKFSPKLLVH